MRPELGKQKEAWDGRLEESYWEEERERKEGVGDGRDSIARRGYSGGRERRGGRRKKAELSVGMKERERISNGYWGVDVWPIVSPGEDDSERWRVGNRVGRWRNYRSGVGCRVSVGREGEEKDEAAAAAAAIRIKSIVRKREREIREMRESERSVPLVGVRSREKELVVEKRDGEGGEGRSGHGHDDLRLTALEEEVPSMNKGKFHSKNKWSKGRSRRRGLTDGTMPRTQDGRCKCHSWKKSRGTWSCEHSTSVGIPKHLPDPWPVRTDGFSTGVLDPTRFGPVLTWPASPNPW
jgi:hypothetical protein